MDREACGLDAREKSPGKCTAISTNLSPAENVSSWVEPLRLLIALWQTALKTDWTRHSLSSDTTATGAVRRLAFKVMVQGLAKKNVSVGPCDEELLSYLSSHRHAPCTLCEQPF